MPGIRYCLGLLLAITFAIGCILTGLALNPWLLS